MKQVGLELGTEKSTGFGQVTGDRCGENELKQADPENGACGEASRVSLKGHSGSEVGLGECGQDMKDVEGPENQGAIGTFKHRLMNLESHGWCL